MLPVVFPPMITHSFKLHPNDGSSCNATAILVNGPRATRVISPSNVQKIKIEKSESCDIFAKIFIGVKWLLKTYLCTSEQDSLMPKKNARSAVRMTPLGTNVERHPFHHIHEIHHHRTSSHSMRWNILCKLESVKKNFYMTWKQKVGCNEVVSVVR